MVYGVVYMIWARSPGKILAEGLPKNPVPSSGAPLVFDKKDAVFVTQCTPTLIPILFEMNRIAYEGSDFELSKDEISSRNTSYIAKNDLLFMLVRDRLRATTEPIETSTINDFIGYTCVLPLTQIGLSIYTMGFIPDRKWPECLVCGNGEPASALLFFALYLDEKHRSKNVGKKYTPFLKRCIDEHIAQVAHAHATIGTEIPVFVQTENADMASRYGDLGYQKTNYKSAEGYFLYRRFYKVQPTNESLSVSDTGQQENIPAQ